ncbi:hypothetical protein HO173_002426 [Letharia columbiana]|uniref:Uncharacterized protein n=1 Tax=Letharia columbiana TaxID=112416 RepID=A0A8H6G3T2_9LECA|nr:uncharacterized protein HO173_002426 [Letharia columbiana]KAF6239879.1 hypothetical protein HO173_002426 [Letharia columbiana]
MHYITNSEPDLEVLGRGTSIPYLAYSISRTLTFAVKAPLTSTESLLLQPSLRTEKPTRSTDRSNLILPNHPSIRKHPHQPRPHLSAPYPSYLVSYGMKSTATYASENTSSAAFRTDYTGSGIPTETRTCPMLTLSKTIREELLAVLHAEAVFSIRSARYFQNKAWTRNDIPFIDHIQRVGLSTAVCALSDEHCNESMLDPREANEQLSKMRAEPTSFFTGTEVPRKTCVIEFILCTPKTMLILQSPLFDAIKHLTGFKTVTLKISSIREHWGPQDALIYIGEDPSFMDHAVGFAAIIDAIGSALEPSLGPNVISEAIVLQGIGWKITFHPRDYLSKQEKPEAGSGAQLEEAADTLTALEK